MKATDTRCLSCGAPSDGDYWCAACYDRQHRDRCVECGELLATDERIVCEACLGAHDDERAREEILNAAVECVTRRERKRRSNALVAVAAE